MEKPFPCYPNSYDELEDQILLCVDPDEREIDAPDALNIMGFIC